MIYPQYCSQRKGESYFHLLRLARINGWSKTPYHEKDKEIVLQTLNSLSEPIDLRLYPILPLIYHNLIKTGLFSFLTEEVKGLIKKNTLNLIAGVMINRQWLNKTIEILLKNDIPVILLKGEAFSKNIYPESTPRTGVDIDLLVHEHDFIDACSILSEIMEPVILNADRITTHKTLFERVFRPRDGSKIIVEVHRGLTNPYIFNINEQDLWSASKQHPAYDDDLIRILSPEDTLLHLAVHAFRDLDFCNHNLLDTHEIFCQWNPDSNILLQRASQDKAKLVLYYLLDNTKNVMDAPISNSVLEGLNKSCLLNHINKFLLHLKGLLNSNYNTVYYRCLQLISQLTFPDKTIRGILFQLHYLRIRIYDCIRIK